MAKSSKAGEDEDSSESLYENVGYTTLKAITTSVAEATIAILMNEFEKALENDEVKANARNGIMPYFYASGLLSLSGREINRESLAKSLESIGITPNKMLIDIVLKAGIKSHLVYAYAFYFLLINGKDTSDANIMRVIDSLGLEPDSSRITEIKEFISEI